MKGLVFGASGMVGAYIAEHLATAGDPVIPVSRRARGDGWITADLTQLETLRLPKADVVFSAANARTLAKALPRVLDCNPRRVVVISSTSVFSKLNTPDEDERGSILELIDAEKSIMETCGAADVEWTILRPTLIYKEGQDRNVTQISKLIRTLRLLHAAVWGSPGITPACSRRGLGQGSDCGRPIQQRCKQSLFHHGHRYHSLPRDGRTHLRWNVPAPAHGLTAPTGLEVSLRISKALLPRGNGCDG